MSGMVGTAVRIVTVGEAVQYTVAAGIVAVASAARILLPHVPNMTDPHEVYPRTELTVPGNPGQRREVR